MMRSRPARTAARPSCVPLLRQRPALEDHECPARARHALLLGAGPARRMLACGCGLAEKDVEPRDMRLGVRPVARAPGTLGHLHSFLRVPARLGGAAEAPRGPGGKRERPDPVVEWRGELRRLVVQGERAPTVLTRARKVAREKAGRPLYMVRQHL